ncbi:MAG: hypothetical protein BMS9Abin19_0133 [Gammaproteobacteria bacterium]|nr:MAG: hypothetical protein BMS9Abin19_0133 [Gammaproteobacteria bacterium]
MKRLSLLLLSILIFNPLHAPAATDASSGGFVEALQMPAWYDRGGRTYPLKAGTKIYSGDIIRTGRKSRVLIRMQEGSIIKLGEDTKLNINTLTPPQQEEGPFAALLRVTRGAFRFTTTELGKNRKRNVDIKIGAVTVGIRGTDIWGRSSPDEDLFALLEGKVAVQRDGETEFIMQDKLSYILAPKGQPTTAVTPIDLDELSDWAKETEPQQGRGIITIDGEWAVNMMSLQSASAAAQLQQKLNDGGYATAVQQTQISGKTWLRVRIEGFATRQDANIFASSINYKYGIEQPWVVKF